MTIFIMRLRNVLLCIIFAPLIILTFLIKKKVLKCYCLFWICNRIFFLYFIINYFYLNFFTCINLRSSQAESNSSSSSFHIRTKPSQDRAQSMCNAAYLAQFKLIYSLKLQNESCNADILVIYFISENSKVISNLY